MQSNLEILLQRLKDGGNSTIGTLFVDCEFECFTLEDEFRTEKIAGETRIPVGRYRIELRNEGGMTLDYAKRFPEIHKGMLWIRNIPKFKYVYLHIGNTEEHTDGCPLVGNRLTSNTYGKKAFCGDSKRAYVALYKKIVAAITSGREVWITVKDEGQIDFS